MQTLNNLIILDVHARDIVRKLAETCVSSVN